MESKHPLRGAFPGLSTKTGPTVEERPNRHGAVILIAGTDLGQPGGVAWRCQCGDSHDGYADAIGASYAWARHVEATP